MKILVVDDEALLVKGIRFNLQNEGYDVITGSDGLEAVQAVQEQQANGGPVSEQVAKDMSNPQETKEYGLPVQSTRPIVH